MGMDVQTKLASAVVVDLNAVSSHMLTAFPVGQLIQADVFWLNERWFASVGICLAAHDVRRDIEAWLVKTFAVSSLERLCVDQSFGSQSLEADRYGGSGGAIHGGSGRCGAKDGFFAKGIGPTPLVAPNADWSHSHGCLYLYDAVREAIASELMQAELPNGAMPVIAILDAGFSVAPDANSPPERCGILIRPSFLRLAHFERSVYFGTSGFRGSDQDVDSARVRDAIRFADERLGTSGSFDLSSAFGRWANQSGAARAHRIWGGRPTSDNITVTGAHLDFGSFRSLPNWKAADDGHGQVFGREVSDLQNAVPSVLHYFGKYSQGKAKRPDEKILVANTSHQLVRSFMDACATAVGFAKGSPAYQAFGHCMLEYYAGQQRQAYLVDAPSKTWGRQEWLYHPVGQKGGPASSSLTARVAKDILQLIQQEEEVEASARRAALLRWLSPRPTQYYHVSKSRARRAVAEAIQVGRAGRAMIHAHISREIALARRVWSDLRRTDILLGYVVADASEALFILDALDQRCSVRLSGARSHQTLRLFGQDVSLDDIALASDAAHTWTEVACEPALVLNGGAVRVGSVDVIVPPAVARFRDALDLLGGGHD